MKVYVLPADDWACGSYRLTWPAQAAAEVADEDVEVIILPHGTRNLGGRFDPASGRVVDISRYPKDADVLVIQRPTSAFQPQVIDLLRERGVAVIVDMDDDLGSIHPKNPAHAALAEWAYHPVHGRVKNLHHNGNAVEACRRATLVTVTTPRLAQVYGTPGRVRVVPNYVPASYLAIPHRDSELIGWGGHLQSHPNDLQVLGRTMERLVGAGHRFATVGNPHGIGQVLGLRDDPPSPGDVPLLEWAPNLARFGIGIAPLADTAFNQAKSRLKPLEMASVGLPVVVAPTADYAAWAAEAEGAVLVAHNPRQWEKHLQRLLRSPGLRAEMSEAARAAAARNTIEGNAWRWVEAWHDAYRAERTKAVAGVA